MIGISLVLFFLPAINGLIGGVIGGYLLSRLFPAWNQCCGTAAIAIGVLLWGLFAIFNAPFPGILGGVAGGLWALISSIGLLLGATIGGAVAPARPV